MGITFEVTDKDIGGRIGKLKVGDRVLPTPAILPVINPHVPLVTPAEMARMGARGIITNAYIISRSAEFRQRALIEGLHSLYDFDGVIMTDSGSFQLSVYGDIRITNRETVEFQKAVGSDIFVPLDIPTPPDADRDRTRSELAVTMERLREAREIFGDEAPIAGPVQGGMYPDIRTEAGSAVSDAGFLFCPIGAVVPLMESYRYADLVDVVMAAKKGLSPAACVHLFGAGHPSMFALAVAMGCDVFDSAAYALYAREGRYLTAHGSYHLEELTTFPCPCEVCRSMTPHAMMKSGDRERLLARHNLHVTFAEIDRIHQAIVDGTLYDLVDERCRSHPMLLRGYRQFLKFGKTLETADRVSKRRFFYRGSESCLRTEVLRYHESLTRFPENNRILVSFDRAEAKGFDAVYFFKPPFGPYPQELSETFPIGQSEIPDWDEEMVRSGCRGITILSKTHPSSEVTVRCEPRWVSIVTAECPGMKVMSP